MSKVAPDQTPGNRLEAHPNQGAGQVPSGSAPASEAPRRFENVANDGVNGGDAQKSAPHQGGAQFAETPGGGTRPVYKLYPLKRWRDDGASITAEPLILPHDPRLYFVCSQDIRSVAAALSAAAADADVALDLGLASTIDRRARHEDRKLLDLLEGHRSELPPAGAVAVHMGLRGDGTQFWNHDIDIPKLDAFCQEAGYVVFLAAVGSRASDYLAEIDPSRIIEVDAWPLVQSLIRDCRGIVETDITAVRDAIIQDGLLDDLIHALDSRDADEVQDLISTLRSREQLACEANTFIGKLSDEKATPDLIAVVFTMACFGQLAVGELREIADDLAQTPNLVPPPPPAAEGAAPIPPQKTRVDDLTLRKVGLVSRQRLDTDTGVRFAAMTLKTGGRSIGLIRQFITTDAPMTTAKLMERFSQRLIHGMLRPTLWKSCAEVVARTLLSCGSTAPDDLAADTVGFWIGGRNEVSTADEKRARRLAESGDQLLDELCAAMSELSGVDRRQLQLGVAKQFLLCAEAKSRAAAWRTPAAATFVVRLLAVLDDDYQAETLLSACLAGPPEALVLVGALLTGGFGLTPVAQGDATRMERLLLTFITLSSSERRMAPGVKEYATTIVGRLLGLQLVMDSERLLERSRKSISPELAISLARAAGTVTVTGLSDRFEVEAGFCEWMGGERFEYLAAGWRSPPPYYLDAEPAQRGQLLAAETTFLATVRPLQAVTGLSALDLDRRDALGRLARALGLPEGLSPDLAALWLSFPGSAGPTAAGSASFPLPDLRMAMHDFDPDENQDEAQQHSQASRVEAFLFLMEHLRRATPVLAAAFAEAEIGSCEQLTAASSAKAPDLDHAAWRAIADAKNAALDVLDPIFKAWRNVLDTLPRTPTTQAAAAHALLLRDTLRAWWSELQSHRSPPEPRP